MNPSHHGANSNLRIVLPLMAAVAMLAGLAAFSVASASADSGSGGVAIGSEDEGDDAEAKAARFERLWDRVSRRDKRWARSTAECESGRDPNAIGGGGRYRGAFQFMKSTWRHSPKSPGGDPIDYTYRTQAVVAVALKNRDGASHWPVCG